MSKEYSLERIVCMLRLAEKQTHSGSTVADINVRQPAVYSYTAPESEGLTDRPLGTAYEEIVRRCPTEWRGGW